MGLIYQQPWTVQPAITSKVLAKYRPIGGIQPAGWGYTDTDNKLLTVGSGITRQRRTITFPGDSTTAAGRMTRDGLIGAVYPMSFVFRGTVNNTGVMVLGSVAGSAIGYFNRVYTFGDGVYAQAEGDITNAQSSSGAVLSGAAVFSCVAVFKSQTSRTVYVRGALGHSESTETTDIGLTPGIDRLSFGQFYSTSTGYGQDGTTEIAQWLGVELSAGEARALLVNPWKIFTPVPRRLFAVSGGTSSVTFSAGGTIAFSATTPLLHTKTYLPTGSIAYSGTNLFINANTFAPTGTLVFSGAPAQIHTKINEPSGSIVFTGTNGMSFIPAGGFLISTRLPMTGAGTT